MHIDNPLIWGETPLQTQIFRCLFLSYGARSHIRVRSHKTSFAARRKGCGGGNCAAKSEACGGIGSGGPGSNV